MHVSLRSATLKIVTNFNKKEFPDILIWAAQCAVIAAPLSC